MEIKENISLKSYNTFGIDVLTTGFVEVNNIDDLIFFMFVIKLVFIAVTQKP